MSWQVENLGSVISSTARQCFQHLTYYVFITFLFVSTQISSNNSYMDGKVKHIKSLHLPQLFYFGIFTSIFALGNTLQNFGAALRLMLRYRKTTFWVLWFSFIIVHLNTIESPYLLADPRRASYYIWYYTYGQYKWFKYAMVPFYVVAWALIVVGLQHQSVYFKLSMFLGVFFAVGFYQALDFRHFIVPYVMFRLNTRIVQNANYLQWILVELASNVLVNCFVYYIFFTKNIPWDPITKGPSQRILW